MKARALFIAGTDTGVGKTFVASAFALALKGRGRDVGVMKPVASGCTEGPGGALVSRDAEALMAASGAGDAAELVTPVAYAEPLAPTAAAKKEGSRFSKDRVLRAYGELAARHDFLIIEGIGGLLVPLEKDYTVRDLARDLGAPLLVVARDAIGTINHTALTVEAAGRAGLSVRGVVLNRALSTSADESCPGNAGEIEALTGVRVIARLGPCESLGDAARTLGRSLDIESIFGQARGEY